MLSLISIIISCLVLASTIAPTYEAKPLNSNQIRFRRLPPKEFSAALGSSITIECEAGGSPPPTIHWLKDGKKVLQVSVIGFRLVQTRNKSAKKRETERLTVG